tara:strand:+ start:946 stop:1116 length:171 start_codon:yes stop_codon:yes gene_type:complete
MKRPGLWANIRAKKKEGRSPSKPGEKGYPTKKSWKKVTSLGYGGKVKVVKKNKPIK